jgi:hypothetical protein
MEWVRHHDRYETGALADADLPYWPIDSMPAGAASPATSAVAATGGCCGTAKVQP